MLWPIAIVAISESRMFSGSKRMPPSSAGSSTPVGSPKPKSFAYFVSLSAPRSSPTSANPVLSEFLTTSVNVTVPKLSPFQFCMRLPETMT